MSRLKLLLSACLGLAALTVAAYFPSLWFDFINYDDPKYVYTNPQVLKGLTPETLDYAWRTYDMGNWIPLTWMSYLLDVSLFGTKPAGFHFTNLVLHAANTCLVYLVLQQMTGRTERSLFVAALFALHPLHIQSVAWISERKDVLSTLWMLIALLVYARYACRPGVWSYFGVFVAMALGLMAKSMLVTLPILLLLLDFWPLRRWSRLLPEAERSRGVALRPLLLEKIPLLALALADGGLTIIAQRSVNAMPSFEAVPLSIRVANSFRSIGWYLWKTAWPTNLCPYYPAYNIVTFPWTDAWWAIGVVTVLTGWIVWNWSRWPWAFVGWFWFVITLLPVLGILQVGGHAQADRYMYVPHLGLFLLIAWAGGELASRGTALLWLTRAGAGAVLVLNFVLLRQELAPWQDSLQIWEHALRTNQESYVAHQLLGLRLGELKRFDEAEPHLVRALELNPRHFQTIMSLCMLHLDRNEVDQAREYILWAARIRTDDPTFKIVWRDIAQRGGFKPPERTSSLPKPHAGAQKYLERGQTLFQQNDLPGSKEKFLAALELEPDYPAAHNCLAIVLAHQQDFEAAETHYRRAVDGDPENTDFLYNLADFYRSQLRWDEALKTFERVLEINPLDAEARVTVSRIRKNPPGFR